jgi:hypothetical protein
MSDLRILDLGDLTARAAAALARASGRETSLEDVQPFTNAERRNMVARAIARDAAETRRIIIKATRAPDYDPAMERVLQVSGLAREYVATTYLGHAAPGGRHCATLLAGDAAAGLLVFEDLGQGLNSLDRVLLRGSAEEAEQALTSYAGALGRLHADTVGCAEAYHAAYREIFGASRTRRPIGWQVEEEAKAIAGTLGHIPPADELAFLSQRLGDPGPWLALVHGDPCPDNTLIVDGNIRLIDYEWARTAHVLLDGLYWRVGFPTCWCAGRVSADVAARLDAAYRRELGRSVAAARDDAAYAREAAYISAVWLFTCLSWRLGDALERDEKWGIWSIRGRLLWYLELVVAVTEAAAVLPGLNASARAWLEDLRRRWPEAMPLGLYPAFATPSS